MSNYTVNESRTTGVVYHEDMVKHYCLWDTNYPESPERFLEILKRCEELELLSRCKKLTAEKVTHDELLKKHSQEVIELLKETENKTEIELEEISSKFDSIYICSETYNAALFSVGSTLRLIRAICENEVKNGIAIVRPPGHHAMKSEYCGYCFFNNVAIAANYALEKFNLSKILIVDWDVHHGQGTQQMFYEDPRVLYFSIHRYEHGTFWPNLRESNCDYIGKGSGRGYNFNIPLNKTGLGNAEYLAIFHHILLPVSIEYQPELIIISAGYDAVLGCPEFQPELIIISSGYDACLGDEKGEMKVTPACYAHFVNSLKVFAHGKIAVVLEGGYCLKSLAEGAALTLRALLDDPCPNIGPIEIHKNNSIRETIFNVIHQQRSFWKCFQIYDTYIPSKLNTEINAFVPVIKYEYEEIKFDRFPTRNCYPIVNEETSSKYLTLINNLIEDTEIYVPKYKAIFLSSCQDFYHRIYDLFQNSQGKIIRIDKNYDVQENVLEAINCLLNNSTRSVILNKINLTAGQNGFNVEDFILNNTVPFNKVLLIDFYTEIHLSKEIITNKDNFLCFSFIDEIFRNCKSDTDLDYFDNKIEIVWNGKSVGDYEYIMAWLKIILPLSYQFNSKIIVLIVNSEYHMNVSPELFGFLIHLLTSLANGRIIFITNCNVKNDFAIPSFISCCKALLGYSSSPFKINNSVCLKAIDILKNLDQILVERWSKLSYFLKLPVNEP